MANYVFKDFEGSSHRILIELIRRYATTRGTLVDLGAAGGEIGASVRTQFDRTFGFEFDVSRIAELRARFDHAVITDLNKLARIPASPRAIVMADVLEHLHHPDRILALVRRSIAPDGLFFLSVPNVANITIRLALLAGRFQYSDRGILDRTHLHFYTPATIRHEVEQAGFDIIESTSSAMPLRLVAGDRIPDTLMRVIEKFLSGAARVSHGLLGYQTILVARPRGGSCH